MKITSKSILSTGGAGVRDPPNSLSNSLSRRLKNSGSIKGGASPAMFPTAAAKKRGSFEIPEPSSPKVTCIGQIRVKGRKKQAKKLKSLSRRYSSNEVSFRKLDQTFNGFSLKNQTHKESLNLGSKGSQIYVQSQNQECTPETVPRSWVHFPVTICDALRAFGSEFSCLFPCRKEEKMVVVEDGNRQGSCGVFARLLVAVQDGDNGGDRRDIELVVGEEDEIEEDESVVFRKTRRHVFEDLEIVNDRIEGHKDEARVSICIPPKNALLLMRCRSDPVKIQVLSNRSWELNVATNDEELAENEDQIQDLEVEQQKVLILDQNQENVQQVEVVQDQKNGNVQKYEVGQDQEHEIMQKDEMGQDQEVEIMLKDKTGQDQELEILQKDEVGQAQEHEFMQKDEVGHDQEIEFMQKDELEYEIFQKDEVGHDQNQEKTEEEEESLNLVTLFEEIVNQEMLTEFAKISETHEENLVKESKNVNNGVLKRGSENVLPECLLMMMYEPKLSMEVSKETWVCSKDFIRRNSSKSKPPSLPALASVNGGDESKATATVTTNGTTFAYDIMRVAEPILQQATRSSCSFPAASMATMLEEKLKNAVGYEPFVPTRCKSEPIKTAAAAAKLLPESCVWENRKLELLSRGTFVVGVAGLGF